MRMFMGSYVDQKISQAYRLSLISNMINSAFEQSYERFKHFES